jgi:hypothetical protein
MNLLIYLLVLGKVVVPETVPVQEKNREDRKNGTVAQGLTRLLVMSRVAEDKEQERDLFL